jgi:hypothetical protein
VLGQLGIAGVVESLGEGSSQADALVKLADGQQPDVAGELAARGLDDERRAEEFEDLRSGGWHTHRRSPQQG